MRSALVVVLAGAVAAVVLLAGCSVILGGVPRNVELSAESDSTVRITWDAPSEGTPAGYFVYFEEVGSPSFTLIAETTATSFVHHPGGITGRYKIVARFGEEIHEAAARPSTIPVPTEAVRLAELDASGNSGYGWNRSSGEAATFPMDEQGSADGVDLYISDYAAGFLGPTYSVHSPDHGLGDPSGVVPTAAWRMTGLVDVSPSEDGPLPSYDEYVYLDYCDLASLPLVVGCYTKDGHYAVLRVNSVDLLTGEVEVESWFQLVHGLRLVKH